MPGPVRIEVMNGVNLNMLGKREPEHYGTLTLDELEREIEGFAGELGVGVRFFHTNFEGEYVEHLHNLGELVDAVVLNPGAWTHYAWAIHDALLTAGLPAVEVHLSDLRSREPWRQLSVIENICVASFTGEGPTGYRRALERLRDHLGGGAPA